MIPEQCPLPETLFDSAATSQAAAHARGCKACQSLLEAHRQLEKDLFRLADPLPPPDFTAQVMAKVAAAPARPGADLRTALVIWAGASALFLMTAWLGGNPSSWGVQLAEAAVGARGAALVVTRGVGTLWEAAAPQVAMGAGTSLFVALWMLRRLWGSSHAEVLS